MSGRDETLKRTRCPACDTIFRVTADQLRLRAGMVRCGQCQHVFNAFEHWQDGAVEHAVEAVVSIPSPEISATPFIDQAPSEALVEPTPARVFSEPEPAAAMDFVEPATVPDAAETIEIEIAADTTEPPVAVETPVEEPVPSAVTSPEPILAEPAIRVETPEETTQAARDVGLVAARDLSETPAFNRWAAGTLASDGLGGFAPDAPRRMLWPFVLVAMLLAATLLTQLALHFRSELVQRVPAVAPLYAAAGLEIPLPRNPGLVSIEASDLQSDNARGLFVLQATLKNRAEYAQAWPALELALTDVNDAVVSRRVMFAADYLPPGSSADAFAANSELAVRLWLEAKEIGASGYRLYLFYP